MVVEAASGQKRSNQLILNQNCRTNLVFEDPAKGGSNSNYIDYISARQ